MLVISVKKYKIKGAVKKVIDIKSAWCYNVYIEQRSS